MHACMCACVCVHEYALSVYVSYLANCLLKLIKLRGIQPKLAHPQFYNVGHVPSPIVPNVNHFSQ